MILERRNDFFMDAGVRMKSISFSIADALWGFEKVYMGFLKCS